MKHATLNLLNFVAVLMAVCAMVVPQRAYAQPPTSKDDSMKQGLLEANVKVTPETYIRAETDRQFAEIAKMAGGINRFYHFRSPTPLDKQNVVRMNRDTLYSMGIVDTSKGATITVPELPKDRYVSVYLVDNDHYTPFVIYSAGTHELPKDTKYLALGIRIQVFNPKDPNEIALVNKLQDQFVIRANSVDPLPKFKWDLSSLKTLTAQYEKDSAQYSSWKGMQGPRGKVDEKTRHIAAAAAWGLFPEWDATYLNYSGGHDPNVCHKATYNVPENNAFWSITVYGNDGFMKSENNIVNSSNVKLNTDGTFTVYFGAENLCGVVPNRLDVTEGWNFLMRVYRPGASVMDGTYELPKVEESPAVAISNGLESEEQPLNQSSPTPSAPEGELGGQSLSEAANDPTASLMSLQIYDSYTTNFHKLSGSANTVVFRPVIPFKLGDTNNILRITAPIITSNPVLDSGLSDLTIFNLVVFNEPWGRWGVGPVALIPTGGAYRGAEKWAIGPAIGFTAMQDKLLWGLFNQNLFSFAGDSDRQNVNLSILQPILFYGLGDGWSIGNSEMSITYDWEASRFSSLPLGIKIGKLVKVGTQPLQFSLQYEHDFANDAIGPANTIQFNLKILFPG